ncbi:DNA alkylation repair protein [Massilioclostridium coli]|uniref:DNA alkylation repair protein n=1 Tax=Massilioclostridium coli TaxID=1870991 RepID=UPI0022E6F224|nr:DNA alkylation repair protein [Massilioclostridium coli]
MGWKKENWTAQDYTELLQYLRESSESKFQQFQQRLIPDTAILGIRTPKLRSIAKEIAKGNVPGFLQVAQRDWHEERLLQGLVIGYWNVPFSERLEYLTSYLPLIDNWAICDMVCNTLTCFQKDAPEGFHYLLDLLQQDNPWIIRFVLIMFLSHYLQDDYIDRVLEASASVTNDHYYVRMGNAWLLSVAFVKYRDKTVNLLKSSRLDDWTYHKTLQKIMESNRVDQATKEWISTMKALR